VLTYFANNIRLLRLARGLTQAQLARAARLSMPYISMLERGLQPSRPDHIKQIAAALGVTPDAITDGDVRARVLPQVVAP
jgi:transcriptional regulator with XRE-family HTH domain